MFLRIQFHRLQITCLSANIGRYTMIKHEQEKEYNDAHDLTYFGVSGYTIDGLNSLTYSLVARTRGIHTA